MLFAHVRGSYTTSFVVIQVSDEEFHLRKRTHFHIKDGGGATTILSFRSFPTQTLRQFSSSPSLVGGWINEEN